MLQKNQSRDAFKDLSMFLTGFYNDKAHAAYKSFQGQCKDILKDILSDLSPVVESDRKFMESVINKTLEDWIKTWSVDTLREWYHDKLKANPLNAELINAEMTHSVDAGFEGDEPEVIAAIKLYMAYLNGKRENISPDGLFLLSIIVECKFVSILFANADRVFDVLERVGVFTPYGWKHSTWLVRMGTSIEVEISKLFPMLDLRNFKAQLGKRGREAIQQSNEENLENILKVLRPMVKDKSQSEICFDRVRWQKDILMKHFGSVPDSKTIRRRKAEIEKRLSDDFGRKIQIKVSKR